jgi:hypothetical protein
MRIMQEKGKSHGRTGRLVSSGCLGRSKTYYVDLSKDYVGRNHLSVSWKIRELPDTP